MVVALLRSRDRPPVLPGIPLSLQRIESGILTDRDRVELRQGDMLELSPVGKQHAACVDRTNELFVLVLASQAMIRVQSPIHLSNDT